MSSAAVKGVPHSGLRCLHCGDVIVSLDRHDYSACSCGKCAIDGGFDYHRIAGSPEDYVMVAGVYLDGTWSAVAVTPSEVANA